MKTTNEIRARYVIRCFAACPDTLFIPINSLCMDRIFDGKYSWENNNIYYVCLLGSYWKFVDIPIYEKEAMYHPIDIFRVLLERKMIELSKEVLASKTPASINAFVKELSYGVIGSSCHYLTCFQIRRIERLEIKRIIIGENNYPLSKLIWCIPMKRASKQILEEMHERSKKVVGESARIFYESLESQANERGRFSINDERRAGAKAEKCLKCEISRQGIHFSPDSLTRFSELTSNELHSHCDVGEVFRIVHPCKGLRFPSGFVAIEPKKSMALIGVEKVVDEFQNKALKFLTDRSLIPTI